MAGCWCAGSSAPSGPGAFSRTPFSSRLVSGILSNTLWRKRRSTSGHDTTSVTHHNITISFETDESRAFSKDTETVIGPLFLTISAVVL